MHHFFAYIARLRHITRWALMRNTSCENVQEHSHQVAVIAHALAVIGNTHYGKTYDPGQVTVVALYHDATEILTGDLPTPIKYYNPAIQSAYKQVEAVATGELVSMLPPSLQPMYHHVLACDDAQTHRLVKAADKLSAYIKCVEEVKAGNNEFRKAMEQTYRAIEAMDMAEVDYFIEHFLPSFSLTLDELQ